MEGRDRPIKFGRAVGPCHEPVAWHGVRGVPHRREYRPCDDGWMSFTRITMLAQFVVLDLFQKSN